jgi:hypothetical protein
MGQRYFIRTKSEKLVYRDEKGRFVSKEKAIREGLPPKKIEVTTYRDSKGSFVSKKKVKRSKQKIIDTVRGENVIIPDQIQIPKKAEFVPILGQAMRRTILDASVENLDIAFLWKGRLYKIKPQERYRLQEAWLDLSALAVDNFKKGGSLYYSVDIAEEPGKLVIDFDSMAPTDQDLDSEESKNGVQEFNKGADKILRSFF